MDFGNEWGRAVSSEINHSSCRRTCAATSSQHWFKTMHVEIARYHSVVHTRSCSLQEKEKGEMLESFAVQRETQGMKYTGLLTDNEQSNLLMYHVTVVSHLITVSSSINTPSVLPPHTRAESLHHSTIHLHCSRKPQLLHVHHHAWLCQQDLRWGSSSTG